MVALEQFQWQDQQYQHRHPDEATRYYFLKDEGLAKAATDHRTSNFDGCIIRISLGGSASYDLLLRAAPLSHGVL